MLYWRDFDASGKTTQSKMLVQYLNACDQKAVWTCEPGSPLINLKVRDLLLSKQKLNPRALELLFEADRAEHTAKVKELLEQGYWVVSDRSFISGLAYGIACGHKHSDLDKILSFAIQCYPDHVFVLDILPKEAYKRRVERGEAETREEAKGLEFAEKVRQNFLGWGEIMTVIDGTRPIQEIFQVILNTILPYRGLTEEESKRHQGAFRKFFNDKV